MKCADNQKAPSDRTRNELALPKYRAHSLTRPFGAKGSAKASQRFKQIIEKPQKSVRPAKAPTTVRRAPRIRRNGGCLHEIFEQCVDMAPSAIALECGPSTYTYEDLDQQANRLAHCLRRNGVERGSTVGFLLERSEWPVIALLAILKAGATYVPIDPSLPVERIRYIAEHADFALLLTDDAMCQNADAAFDGPIITINEFSETASEYSAQRLSRNDTGVMPEDVCYILFTSGTTGRPKGVVTEHRNAVHFVHAFNEACETTQEDRIFQGFAMGFDGSVEEIWMAFSNRATLVCGDRNTPRFGAELAQFMNEARITYFSTVPTMLSTLTADVPSLRQVVVSGEACQDELVNRWASPGRAMLNVYGPTEATVNTTIAKLEPGKPVTIGVPLRGYELHVLDENLKPVPHGEKGELYIGGPGISRGYLKQAEQTAAAYINWQNGTPQKCSRSTKSDAVERIYKTGDLVRWNEQNELEIFGRIDSQVKLRGYRIELAEIEKVLLELPEFTGAAVTVAEVNGNQQLAAYVLRGEETGRLDRQHVLQQLRSRLAPYMVPATLDVLDEFPMLVSGKINRKLLPEPKRSLVILDPIAREIETDATQLENDIAKIWANKLNLATVGMQQNFFTELGGHSMLAAQIIHDLQSQLGIEISVREFYGSPTVRSLAAKAQQKANSTESATSDVGKRTPISAKWSWRSVSVQVLYFLAVMPLLALPAVIILPLVLENLQRGQFSWQLGALGLALTAGMWVGAILLAIAAKWLLIGRFRPGRYPLWGSIYVRWWIASRLQHLCFLSAFNGTPLAPWLWRAMGAKVGANCHLDATLVYAWDCISVGDDVSIGADTHLAGLRVENGELVIGTIDIGERCFIGSHSSLGLNVRMEAEARLDDQSALPDGMTAEAGVGYCGSPPLPAGVAVPSGEPYRVGWFHQAVFCVLQLAFGTCVALAMLAPLAIASWSIALLALHSAPWIAFAVLIPAVPLTMMVFAVWWALCRRVIQR